MGYIDELMRILHELKSVFAYKFDIANIYGIADFRRNEFVFYGKKAIREFIRKYAKHVNKYRKTEVAQALNRAIMKLWNYPELRDTLEREITDLLIPTIKSDVGIESSVLFEIPKPLEFLSEIGVDSQIIFEYAPELECSSDVGIKSEVLFSIMD